jgi:hypothetical protein
VLAQPNILWRRETSLRLRVEPGPQVDEFQRPLSPTCGSVHYGWSALKNISN